MAARPRAISGTRLCRKLPNLPPVTYAETAKTQFRQFCHYVAGVFSENFTLGSTPSDTYQIIGNIRMPITISLSTHFAQQVVTAAGAGCNTTASGTIRTARQLCGPNFWDALTKPEQIQAGHIISTAVEAGMLPVIKLERSGSNHQRYQLS